LRKYLKIMGKIMQVDNYKKKREKKSM